MRALLPLLCLGVLAAAEEDPPALDEDTIRRAEAAADAYQSGDWEAYPATPPAPADAVELDEEQRERLSQAGVLLLEATTHLGIDQGSEALGRWLEAHAILEALPAAAAKPGVQAELVRNRQRLVALGRHLLEAGHLTAPATRVDGAQAGGDTEEEPAD